MIEFVNATHRRCASFEIELLSPTTNHNTVQQKILHHLVQFMWYTLPVSCNIGASP